MYPVYKTIDTCAYIHTHIDTLTSVYIHAHTCIYMYTCIYTHVCVCVCQLVSNSLWPYGLKPARLLCPWNFLGKKTGVGCHFLFQGNLPKPGIEPASLVSLALADGFFTAAPHVHIHTHIYRTTRLHSYSKVNAFCNAMNCYWSLLCAKRYSRSCSFLGSTLLLYRGS